MAFPRAIWIPSHDDDSVSGSSFVVWKVPEDFNSDDLASASNDPEVYNDNVITQQSSQDGHAESQQSSDRQEPDARFPSPDTCHRGSPMSNQQDDWSHSRATGDDTAQHQSEVSTTGPAQRAPRRMNYGALGDPAASTPRAIGPRSGISNQQYSAHNVSFAYLPGPMGNVPSFRATSGTIGIRHPSHTLPAFPYQGYHQASQSFASPMQMNFYQHPATTARHFFQPMRTKENNPQLFLTWPGSSAQQTAQSDTAPVERVLAGFSANYQGDISVDRNRSADIPAHENCSFFITGLPPMVTVASLLGAIRDVGRIYATYINPPITAHATCAAKLTFFDRPSANRFYAKYRAGLIIPQYPQYTARITWNRVKVAAVVGGPDLSRVLIITGPAHLAHPDFLIPYFESKFDFQLDEVITHSGDGFRSRVEVRFGSYRCQAESGKLALTREFGRQLHVVYGRDPCDVVSEAPFQGY